MSEGEGEGLQVRTLWARLAWGGEAVGPVTPHPTLSRRQRAPAFGRPPPARDRGIANPGARSCSSARGGVEMGDLSPLCGAGLGSRP